MNNVNHYDVLGVPGNASLPEIHAAYARAMEALRVAAANGKPDHERFDAVLAAYKILRDDDSRNKYDAALTHPAITSIPPLPVRSTDDGSPKRLTFEFTGEGGEYFRIWIVNLLLSIVTLGIYSAWAKVRREKYFHHHMLLEGSGFDYHGKPKAILKGRILVFGTLLLLSAIDKISPAAHAVALICLLPVVPWVVVRAFRFRTYNTTYRGLRFGFNGDYRQALTTFVGFGLLSVLTLGLAIPLFLQRQKVFVVGNLRYGTADFSCEVSAREFYAIFMKPIIAFVGAIVVAVILAKVGSVAAAMIPVLIVAVVLAFQILLIPYIRVRTTNAVWNNTRLAEGDFASEMTIRGFLGIVVGNLILLILTFGFFWPWAAVRMARYRAECLSLTTHQSMNNFIAGESTRASALGDEAADMFDVDVAL